MISAALPNKSFWLGVATALSAVWVAQLLSSKQKSSHDNTRDNNPKNTATTSNKTSTPQRNSNETDDTTPEQIIMDAPDLDLRMIRKAEAVIQWRTSRITVVVERCSDDHNYSAILRTAEALGINTIWIIDPPPPPTLVVDTETNDVMAQAQKNNGGRPASSKTTDTELKQRAMHHLFAQKATEWLTVREFPNTAACIQEMRATNHQIWVTDLSQQAVTLTPEGLASNDDFYRDYLAGNQPFTLPPQVAIVMGTESVGCTDEMLQAADKRVYLPLRGFADSLNLSVATALVLHQLFVLDPSVIGAMAEEERRALRLSWFTKLCQQRLLSPSQKRLRTKLLSDIRRCEAIQAKLDQNEVPIQPKEKEKLANYESYKQQLQELEQKTHFQQNNNDKSESSIISKAIQDLVDHPPSPLTDLRRADCHRVTYVGKGTKKKNQEHWGNMAATTSYDTQAQKGISSNFFRDRVQQAASS